MTSFQLFEAIGTIDELLISEVNNTSYKKQRKIYTTVVLAACAMLAICIFANREKIHQNHTGSQVHEIVDHTPTETPQGKESEKKAVDNVVINKIDSLHSNAKFGGRLKAVSERQWQKQYGMEDFLKAHKTKYELSYSKTKEILYGVVRLELSKNNVVEILVNDEEMLDSSLKELKTTLIGNDEVAICKINNENDDGNFCAIVNGDNAVYTIEESDEITENQFVFLLKEIFEIK